MMSNLNAREKGLLVLSALVLMANFYYVGRIHPQLASLKALAERVGGLEQKVQGTRPPRYAGDLDGAKKQTAEAQARLDEARKDIDRLLDRRVDQDSNVALEGVIVEIRALANQRGVAIDESGAFSGSLQELGAVSEEELHGLQGGGERFRFRPLRTLSLTGDYPRLRNFIRELLEHKARVNVLKLTIRADSAQSVDQRSPALSTRLRAELVLAL
jgi:hypothetical protein